MQEVLESSVPPFTFSRFFEDVHVREPVDGAMRVEWLPNGRTQLVLRVLEEGRRGDLSVAGPRTHALFKQAAGLVRATVLSFKPGWSAPLIGVPANELTDKIISLGDIWGRPAGDLLHELLTARSTTDVLERLARGFARRSQETFEPASARLARQAVRLLEGDETRMTSVAAQLGITARHLRRAFTESVGIGPKEFARTVRLQRALKSAALSNDWGRIAADAGYYDQAHLIAEFRELVGLTPGAFVKRAGPELPTKKCEGA